MPELARGVEQFRAMRRELESAVLPLATSVDGRRFSFQTSLYGLELRLGGYVVLEDGGTSRFGQVLDLGTERYQGGELDLPSEGDGQPAIRAPIAIRLATGEGLILEGDGSSFHDALLRPATAEEVRGWVERRARDKPEIEIGELALVPGVPCRLAAGGFDRHTFLCGQSGSGKTYSLGVVLERLLTETSLRIIVLDPNSDFVKLGAVQPSADPDAAERYRAAAAGVVVHTGAEEGERRLRLRLREIEPAAQAALLHLDPIADREEHAELAALLASGRPATPVMLEETGRPDALRLAMRVKSLGLEQMSLWAREQPGSLMDAVTDPDVRALVVDLGSLGTREEQSLTAAAVLAKLWEQRTERNPVLIVIDEAHNICPARPEDALTAIATGHAVRIAAEGRKFGLYLLVSTQRPQKVHENVVSQCDNLMLMRLNSSADAAFTAGIFSFVPPSLIDQAATFGLGEALVAGKMSPQPALARFGARTSQEGGADVATTWAG